MSDIKLFACLLSVCFAFELIEGKKDFYQFTAVDITGDEVDLGRYRGKVKGFAKVGCLHQIHLNTPQELRKLTPHQTF